MWWTSKRVSSPTTVPPGHTAETTGPETASPNDPAGYHARMCPDPEAAYLALKARDARFDGRFFVGVMSTGIYCRPVCRVRTPKRENCRFFATAAQADAQAFRPCLKCRPELAPGAGRRCCAAHHACGAHGRGREPEGAGGLAGRE